VRADPHHGAAATPHTARVERRVLLVDDDAAFRAVARDLLELGGFRVVGEAGDGVAAVATSRALCPEIVLLDIQLPDIDGFAVAALVAEQDEPPLVVLVSSRDASAYRQRLAASPVRGFISKGDLSAAAVTALVG
jgi:DNA-binding NarL/FixJ family response regulator